MRSRTKRQHRGVDLIYDFHSHALTLRPMQIVCSNNETPHSRRVLRMHILILLVLELVVQYQEVDIVLLSPVCIQKWHLPFAKPHLQLRTSDLKLFSFEICTTLLQYKYWSTVLRENRNLRQRSFHMSTSTTVPVYCVLVSSIYRLIKSYLYCTTTTDNSQSPIKSLRGCTACACTCNTTPSICIICNLALNSRIHALSLSQ